MSKKRRMRNPRRGNKMRQEVKEMWERRQEDDGGNDVCLNCLLKEDFEAWAQVMRIKYGTSVKWWETNDGELVIQRKDGRHDV